MNSSLRRSLTRTPPPRLLLSLSSFGSESAAAQPWIYLKHRTPAWGGDVCSRRGMAEVRIPYVDKKLLQIKYARSSGAGGQHVNKTESKVDMRVNLDDVNLPSEVRERLVHLNSHRINKDNEL
eukprot:CAMPEP_0173451216 /NCGR_PEP_ID=MMETSP1357-20121228/46332_1 /TAXON_ID=77926 /ORGANISM="Hemiselmis rufescens, Strain PCC563" /LENGTH=122 /DNA_ID=CAMNT_0014417961 /DNA_START=45 /DNA_END=410 /DNA_ORIENTATION=-